MQPLAASIALIIVAASQQRSGIAERSRLTQKPPYRPIWGSWKTETVYEEGYYRGANCFGVGTDAPPVNASSALWSLP
jgi:hypothetical protein